MFQWCLIDIQTTGGLNHSTSNHHHTSITSAMQYPLIMPNIWYTSRGKCNMKFTFKLITNVVECSFWVIWHGMTSWSTLHRNIALYLTNVLLSWRYQCVIMMDVPIMWPCCRLYRLEPFSACNRSSAMIIIDCIACLPMCTSIFIFLFLQARFQIFIEQLKRLMPTGIMFKMQNAPSQNYIIQLYYVDDKLLPPFTTRTFPTYTPYLGRLF